MSALDRLDDELVAAARAGDRAAMQELAARYLPLVYAVVGRAADSDLDVDDIVQETMVRLVSGLPGLREQTRFRSWVVTIALRQLADARRAARQQRLARGRLTELVEHPDPASDFVGLVMLRQTLSHEQREVVEATRWLDPAYRDLLSLWWLEVGGHLTRADVAAAVGQPVPHVGVRVQRMRQQLDTARRVVGTLRARPGCPALREVTVAWDGQPDPLWRKRIARHVQDCAGCADHSGPPVPPERLLAGLPLPVPPVHLTAITGSPITGSISDGSTSNGVADGTDTATNAIGAPGAGAHAGWSALRLAKLVLPVAAAGLAVTTAVVVFRPAAGPPTSVPSAPVSAVSLPPVTSAGGTAPAIPPPARPTGFVYPAPGQRAAGGGRLPASASGSEYLGEQKTNIPTGIDRDLGFSGVVNGQSVWTYGDTILDKSINGIKPMAYDSVALGEKTDTSKIHFKNLGSFGQPGNWVPLTPTEKNTGGVSRFAMGGTNVIEYAPGKGLVYYLKNDRQGGVNRLMGAGVAQVEADANGASATRTRPVHSANTSTDSDTLLWGPSDPWYGDIGITYDPRDKKVYAYGNGPDRGVYLARVPATQANDVTAYEYWDQSTQSWYTGVKKVDRNQAIFSHHHDTPFQHQEIFSQSNAFWSNYYNAWMFLTSGGYPGTRIAVMTAPKLEGPWTALTKVSDACPATNAVCYAVAPHPEYDESGKTVLVSYTEWAGPRMTVQLRRITFT